MTSKTKGYVVCIVNQGYPSSLEVRKLYEYVQPHPNDPKSRIRVIDESGEDYLYPRSFFVAISVSAPVRRTLVRASAAA